MVASYLVAFAAPLSWALDHVHARAVVALHVEIAGGESGRLSVVEVPGDGQRLQKYLRHYHGAAEVEDDSPLVQREEGRGEPTEVAVARVAYGRAIRCRMLMNYLGANGSVNGAGETQPVSGEQHRQLAIRQGKTGERASESLAHPPAAFHPDRERLVHAAAGFLRHAEGSVHESAGDVFRGGAEARDLIVVDRGGAVHREVRDHSAIHQVDEKWRQARFHDVAADHDDDRALVLRGGCDRVHHAQEISRHDNIRQRFQEGSEAAVGPRRGCEFGGGDFIGAPFDWNGADSREIDFRDRLGSRAPGLRSRRFRWSRTGAAVTAYGFGAVSYTHLTLPTNREV